ncbi:diacylglycerol kinase [Brucella endophytica]|uniref:Diacylglycerol kinase n=1 Tax=Brucella endophytica TaxID=1963359 RepID=A0A916SND1_9HYPH|nr:cytochrome c [Brucella endophytica]GGB08690.1 diacylglycerol kinase [Brucella endophytica]
MLRKLTVLALVLIALASAGFWFLTAPQRVDAKVLANLAPGDAANGERMFWAGGCASCHAAPGAEGDARLVLAGGGEILSPFGAFVAPNISPSPQGIGAWEFDDFANAMLRGVGPDGSHLYPSFPYTSYIRMKPQDVADLFAYLKTLPQSDNVAPPHRLAFPYNIRRGIGLWKLRYLSPDPVVALDNPPDTVKRGQYLVEGPGHCGECHTPRDMFGGLEKSRWLSGAVSPEIGEDGKQGIVPNITSGEGGISSWSEGDIAYSLESGFTPDFDSLGGSMADVVANMSKLPASDREAIAAYLKAIPGHGDGYKAK